MGGVAMINPTERRAIAEALLGAPLSPEGYASCPGIAGHSTRNAPRDFVVILDGVPTGYCLHQNCAGLVAEFNRELRSRIGRAECDPTAGPGYASRGVSRAPVAPLSPKRPPFDPSKLSEFAARCPREITREWLSQRSPVPIPPAEIQGPDTALLFLQCLYQPGENILIFWNQRSQGDFSFVHGKGVFRLGKSPGATPVPSELPAGGREGLWFLAQPVTGEWKPNTFGAGANAPTKLGRRHGGCVSSWRYAVLESDQAAEADWLRVLVQLPFPIVAVYSSGGKSLHALVRVDARSKAEWDSLRDALLPVLCPLGADGAALTAVRLSRLPGCLRHGTTDKEGLFHPFTPPRLQELVWLNPTAPARPILELVRP
jgi:hypothetical protein